MFVLLGLLFTNQKMKAHERFLDFIIYGIIALIIFFFVCRCKKKSEGEGNILVRVQHDGEALDQPMIYVKYNSPASTTDFDYQQGGDAVGEAYFKILNRVRITYLEEDTILQQKPM